MRICVRAKIEDGEILTTLFDLNIVSCDRRVNNRGADTREGGGRGGAADFDNRQI